MRKLSPMKAIGHALNSVFSYRGVVIRFGLFWIPVLFVLSIVQYKVGPVDPQNMRFDAPRLVQLVSGIVSFVAFCSIAVNWHRFILRDEIGHPARLDAIVWRYLGNSLLIVLIMLVFFVPVIVVVTILAYVLPVPEQLVIVLLLLTGLTAGGIATGLSVKLPAVALGRSDFSFRHAWNATKGNFWQLLGILLLNIALLFAVGLVATIIASGAGLILPVVGIVVTLVLSAILQLFAAVFNASIFTSLYGFFVERREF